VYGRQPAYSVHRHTVYNNYECLTVCVCIIQQIMTDGLSQRCIHTVPLSDWNRLPIMAVAVMLSLKPRGGWITFHAFMLLWPGLWPDGLHLRTWHISTEDVSENQKWTKSTLSWVIILQIDRRTYMQWKSCLPSVRLSNAWFVTKQ